MTNLRRVAGQLGKLALGDVELFLSGLWAEEDCFELGALGSVLGDKAIALEGALDDRLLGHTGV
jgi:hypothetical protein